MNTYKRHRCRGYWELFGTQAAGYNLFNPGSYPVRAQNYRDLRERAFTEWSRAVAWLAPTGFSTFQILNLSEPVGGL